MIEEASIPVEEVKTYGRIRKDFGDIDALATSITSVGLIQPIVIARTTMSLIAGERRLRALRKLNVKSLVHGIHFIYNDEVDHLKLKAMEVEENVKRKDLSWQEEISAKKKLLDILKQIHGESHSGRPTITEVIGATSAGFGINKLASMLGESNAQTSRDIELANLIEQVPQLRKAETKEAARRQAILAVTVATAIQQNEQRPKIEGEARWKLFQGDFITNVNNIDSNTVDLVITDPPYGEETSGMGPNSKELLAGAFSDSKTDWNSFVRPLIEHSHRVLRDDRFAVFFFGFSFYSSLVLEARHAGFGVDATPLVWVKNTVINTSPYTRYGRSYEPILVLRKGNPKLLRPSQRDVIEITNIQTRSQGEEKKLYQAQKPVELIEKFILDMTPPGDSLVCDFCAGSGTTGVAALRQKRRVVLFEKDIIACNIIQARLGGIK